MSDLFGHPVEILSIIRGKSLEVPMALVLLRPHPTKTTEEIMLMFDREQCVRLRDTLNEFLNDRESWLYMPRRKQEALRMVEES